MEFTIKCIKEYKTYNDLVLFECGKKYKLVIQDDNTVIVMYDEKMVLNLLVGYLNTFQNNNLIEPNGCKYKQLLTKLN